MEDNRIRFASPKPYIMSQMSRGVVKVWTRSNLVVSIVASNFSRRKQQCLVRRAKYLCVLKIVIEQSAVWRDSSVRGITTNEKLRLHEVSPILACENRQWRAAQSFEGYEWDTWISLSGGTWLTNKIGRRNSFSFIEGSVKDLLLNTAPLFNERTARISPALLTPKTANPPPNRNPRQKGFNCTCMLAPTERSTWDSHCATNKSLFNRQICEHGEPICSQESRQRSIQTLCRSSGTVIEFKHHLWRGDTTTIFRWGWFISATNP